MTNATFGRALATLGLAGGMLVLTATAASADQATIPVPTDPGRTCSVDEDVASDGSAVSASVDCYVSERVAAARYVALPPQADCVPYSGDPMLRC